MGYTFHDCITKSTTQQPVKGGIIMSHAVIQSDLSYLLQKTAWPMTPPSPWSAFHIIFSLLGLTAAVFLAILLAGHCSPLDSYVPAASRASFILWICGVLLAVSELYKQFFIYEIVNQGQYDWWYFPFQLCSTPMYLCLVFPLIPPGVPRKTAASYLQSFGLLGGIMALAEPSGLMHPFWTLTLHGLLWHIFLVFIALFCAALGLAGKTTRDFLCTVPLFFVFCLVATAINVLTGGKADMFYISPYYPVTQVVFHQISLILGVIPGIGIYLASICVGAFLCSKLSSRLTDHLQQKQRKKA